MKVLNLRCEQRHTFEGWFASENAFQEQLAAGQVECPMCGNTRITKMLSAPRLMLGSGSSPREEEAPSKQEVLPPPIEPALQSAWLKLAQHVMVNTEDVGSSFPEEARKMHYGEIKRRAIRGEASDGERAELEDEGIAVMPIFLPSARKGPVQ